MTSREKGTQVARSAAPGAPLLLAIGFGLLLLYWAYGIAHWKGFVLGLGSPQDPRRGHLELFATLTCLGLPFVVLVLRAARLGWAGGHFASAIEAWQSVERRQFLVALGCLGAAAALVCRFAIMRDARITDDEASYRFSAELLASGRLTVPSPKLPVFFDNGFLINDGRMYGQYFLGWPLLLAAGVLVGAPFLVNPVLHGLTAVVVALIAERRWGAAWGRVAGALIVVSPFLTAAAATELSHTSCLFSLACALLALHRATGSSGRPWDSAIFSLCLCLAFWIRPATALGLGAPMVVWWLVQLPSQRPRHLLAFVAVSLLPALLFLWTNAVMNGSPLVTGYHAAVTHARATAYRFTPMGPQHVKEGFLFFFYDHSPSQLLAKYVPVVMRLWVDAWGWPSGLAALLLASRASARWFGACLFGLAIAHIPLADAGIDSFGPVHYTEAMLPLTLLMTDGLRALWRLGTSLSFRALAPAFVLANLTGSALIFALPRFGTLALLAEDIRAPLEALEQAPDGSIVFYARPFAKSCVAEPARHFVYFRPNNAPDLDDAKLWANHLGVERDRMLVAAMPGRRGYLLVFDAPSCRYRLVPLEEANDQQLPVSFKELPGDFGEVPRR